MANTEIKSYPAGTQDYSKRVESPKLTQEQLEDAYIKRAINCIGSCVRDIGTVLVQGIRPDNAALRGGIAAGLRRAADYMEGRNFDPGPPPETLPITAAELKKSLEKKPE